jgi:uncharacterized protein (DUF1330 family)
MPTKAYLVGHITVTNPKAYAVYSAQVPSTIAAFGGKYLVRGGEATVLEGTALGGRSVVIEFPSRDAAESWYKSDAYQSILKHRTENSTGSIKLIDGYEP